ncbi:urease accessory protein UreD [Sphingomonas sp. LY54]|uniref:urease accessory protein UreD n=1 Tax=Sphingomonas sp. LY54 TaxID=3095343 RepID=UPI002D76646B|nr:urease accessory protein UreD [Sphingomonas sp. LY54]WRP27737.1 urease accessory protein UreD [Sphingomonas sp. LY54]
MNISGGLTGGDRLSIEVAVGEGASATVTTPACEHIYRSAGGDASIEQRLRVDRAARLDWIPQETIVFDRGRVRRRLEVELAHDAEITIAETLIFGRAAMGESVKQGSLSDFWTVRRDGHLLYADAIRIDDPVASTLGSSATLNGHKAFASLLHVGRDLAAKRDELRAAFSLAPGSPAGASIIGDILVARVAAPIGASLRHSIIPALACLRAPLPLPRFWSC